ncbi:MAG: M13 family metallopeptidase, partial [Cytophagaceae bacterium]|nr:M13 family metallopeptidase [Cytophagaceae bacterium]
MNRIALSLLVASGVLALGLMAAEEKPKRGLDVSGMDISVSPREDFYRYANGTWLKTTEIPASETGWGSNYTLRDDNRKNLRKLLDAAIADRQAATGSLTQRVGDFYASGLDSVAVEKRGYDPVKPYLAEIDAIKSVADLLAYISKHPLEGGWSLLAIGVRQSAQNPDTHTVVMSQTGTGLPEKEYYTKTDDATVKIRQAYVDYITTLFTLTSTPEAKARQQAQDILALEAKLAQSHLSQIEMRNPFPRITKVAVEDFAAGVPALDLSARLTGLGLKTDTLTLFAPKYYRKLAELLGSESLETWKAKLRFSVLSGAALYLSSPFVQASFEFNGKALFGVKVYERWKIISLATDDLMGDLLGQLYVKEYFSPVAKKRMDELVANLRTVFARRIDRLDWMSAETKAEAQKKLAALTTKIGYPSKWKAYEGVTINRNDFYGNLKALAQW